MGSGITDHLYRVNCSRDRKIAGDRGLKRVKIVYIPLAGQLHSPAVSRRRLQLRTNH